MRALVYRRSVFRYLGSRLAGRCFPHRFFPWLVPCGLREVPTPVPPPGWLLLRTRLCGLCGSDLGLLKGSESFLLEPYASFPAVLGHEIIAEVAAAPAGLPWAPGDRVVVEPVLPCRVRGLPLCRYCLQGDYHLCENFTAGDLAPGPVLGFNRSLGGGLAAFLVAHPSQLVRVPDALPDDVAVLTDSLASALHPALRHFPADDRTVVVYGAGIIGQHLIRGLRALGCRARLVAVARHPFQQELALAGGADEALLAPSRAALGAAVGARLLPTTLGGGNLEGGADLFFDCVGSARSLQEGLLALRSRGVHVLVGAAAAVKKVDLSSLWFRELTLTGSVCYAFSHWRGRNRRTYELAVELLSRPDFPTRGLLTHVFPLAAYVQAFRAAYHKAASRAVKVAVDPRPQLPRQVAAGDLPWTNPAVALDHP